MQTDVKVQRQLPSNSSAKSGPGGSYWRWLDEAHMALRAAERVEHARLLWHKIIFSGDLDKGGGRNSAVAGYSHYLCFSTGPEPESLDSFPCPDVLRKGLSTWVAGSGAHCLEEVSFGCRT